MKLFAGNKSTKLQRKLQHEEQLLFEQEQAKRRAQIVQDEEFAKQLQDEENRLRGESTPQQTQPPPLPTRPPKPLAYHPEYLPRQQSDPSPTTPTVQSNNLPFNRIRTTSTPSVLESSTFPPRSPVRTSPVTHLPSNGRSSPPLYPPTISPSPPSRPTSTQSYPHLTVAPPNPSTSAPPTFPRRDPVMFIVPNQHSNPAPRTEQMPVPTPVVNTNAHYSSSVPAQSAYPNNSYNDQLSSDYFQYPQTHHQHNNATPSTHLPTYPKQWQQQQQQAHQQSQAQTQTQIHTQQHQHAQAQQQKLLSPQQLQHRQQMNHVAVEKPDEIREKQLYEKKKRSSKESSVSMVGDDSDSESDNYSDFVVRLGPMMAHKKMAEGKTSADHSRPEKPNSLTQNKVADRVIELVDPFADTNAIEWEEDVRSVHDAHDGHEGYKELHSGDQVGSLPPTTTPVRPSLAVDTEIHPPDSAANFRQMQARLSALLNGAPDQPKSIREIPTESDKIEKEDEELTPDEKVEIVNEITVASVNTPAQFHSPLHTRSKSTPSEQFATPAQVPQPYTRTTQAPNIARPPIPKTPKPHLSRSKSFSESPTSPSAPTRNNVIEPNLYPPIITPSLPPSRVQSGDVLAGIPQNEFGFYRVDTPLQGNAPLERKALPHLPPNLPKDNSENRHITCKLPKHFTAGHRVWIAIKPTDTGKTLAQRIHVVATFRTMKITGLRSANGRQIPLDSTPVFGTWQEIENFQDGELWTFETGGEPENFLIQGGKDWFKQIITNIRE